MLTAVLLALSACAPAYDEACRPGFARAGDGHCYPPPPDPDPPSATEALEGLPPCRSLEPDGLVDLDGGCVEGACVRAPFAEVDEALGGDVECAVASWSEDWVYCSWPQHVEGLFQDLDHDLLADPDATSEWLHLQPGYPHATADGLGVGVSPRCWVDALGVPTWATWVDVSGALALQDLYWEAYGVDLHDWTGPDGVVDDVYLFGAR